jgi:hypothetical protein
VSQAEALAAKAEDVSRLEKALEVSGRNVEALQVRTGEVQAIISPEDAAPCHAVQNVRDSVAREAVDSIWSHQIWSGPFQPE